MILSDHTVRVWLYQQATDMRKSFRGLIALVKTQLEEDPLSGHLFVFINKRKTYMKVLYYSEGGFCIWMKKLTQGQFAFSEHMDKKKSMSWQELQWLIDGVEFEKIKYRKRLHYSRKNTINTV
jgi:transposase